MAVALLTLSSNLAWAMDKVVLQLRWDNQFQFAGYYAALAKGFYKDAGLDVELRPGLTPDKKRISAINEVSSGRADFGIGSSDILLAVNRGKKLKVVASIFQTSPVIIAINKDLNISAPAQLKGLRVRRLLGGLLDAEYVTMMRAEGLDPDSVKTVDLSLKPYDLLFSNKADAYIGYILSTRWNMQKYNHDVSIIKPSSYGVDFYGDSIFTSEELIKTHPERVIAFKEASLKGWKYAMEHSLEIADWIALNTTQTLPVQDAKEYNRFLIEDVKKLTLYPVVELGNSNPKRWLSMHQSLKAANLVQNTFDYETFVFDPVRDAQRKVLKRNEQLMWFVGLTLSLLILLFIALFILRKAVASRTFSLTQEIEDRKKAEFKLSKFLSVIEQSPAMVFITDTNGVIEYVNSVFPKLTGYSAKEAIGQTPRILKSEDTPNELYEGLWAKIKSGHEWHHEIKDRRKDGSHFWADVSIVPVKDTNGITTHFVATHNDISRRKEAESAAGMALQHAEIANRAKSDLMANMSHELRTPLNAIIGFSGTMKEEMFGPIENEKYSEYISDIYHSGIHLLSVINDILDVSAIEAGSFQLNEEKISIPQVIDASIRIIQPRAVQGHVSITTAIGTDLPLILVDQRRLKQVLLNLLSNAVKFTQESGEVTVSAWVNDHDKSASIAIADTGVGMDAVELEKAMSKFGQVDSGLDRKHEGTGLGLPLTKGLIELHGGILEIKSTK
ncbi:MAG: ABC transporter substrate-binding protein, partial [Magnetovibrio sp.]|nr:ABC transporter substrate-binding protein [Magnetovibrio sp.]